MPTSCFDPILLGHDVMETLGSKLNFHMHYGLDIKDSWISYTTYLELLFRHENLRKKEQRSASEESDLSVCDSHLTIAEERYIAEDVVGLFDLAVGRSLIRDEMISYFSNRQRSVGRNEVAHPFSTAVESRKFWGNDGFVFYELHDSPTARGKDPELNRWLLDGLDKLEELSHSDKLPEFLSKAKTCFVMQLWFLKNILTLESKPPEDAKDGPGAWVTIVKKGQRPVKTTHKASGKLA